MARIWMAGGSGADVDPVTAESWQVLQDAVIVDKNGNPLTGTMPNRAAINPMINAGERFPIPEGYHNGLGGVTANSLVAQTPGNLQSNYILSPYFGWSNGVKVQGNIASIGAQTISPTSYQQTVQTAGKYLSGNVTVNGVTNLKPENVKKGVQIGDVKGVWEGWVPTANDLYYRGNNVAGFVSSDERNFKFETAQITVSGYHIGAWGGSSTLRLNNFNLTKSSSLNMEFSVTIADNDSPPKDMNLYIVRPGSGTYGNPLGAASWSFANPTTNRVLSINTSALQEVVDIVVYIYHVDTSGYRGYITRMWTN